MKKPVLLASVIARSFRILGWKWCALGSNECRIDGFKFEPRP